MKRFIVALGLAGMLAAGVAVSGPPAQGAPVTPPAASAPNQVLCGTPTWGQAANYPVGTESPAVVSLGNDLYSFGSGGGGSTGGYKYTAATNSWAAISQLPTGRDATSAVTDGTYIYILNGRSGNSASAILYRYDPGTDSYTTMATPPVATTAQAAVYLNGKIYRIGGFDSNSAATATVDVYTISSNSWAATGTVAAYPLAAEAVLAVADGGYIYAGGGDQGIGITSTMYTKTYRYDPVANNWDDSAVSDFRQTHLLGVTGVINGRWVLAGGYDPAYQVDKNVETLDLTTPTGAWVGQPWMPQWRFYAGGAVAGARLYVVSGLGLGSWYQTDVQYFSDTPCTGGTPTPTVIGTPTAMPPTPACDTAAWVRQDPYPVPAAVGAVVAQGGLVYSFGGLANGVGSANAYKMTPTGFGGGLWAPIAPLPEARQGASAVSDGTYIYILNGDNSIAYPTTNNTLYRYDPATNTYTTLAPSPLSTTDQGAVYLNGKIYRIGGAYSTGSFTYVDTATVDVYTISTNTWAPAGTIAPYTLGPMRPLAVAAYGGYIYAVAGNQGTGPGLYLLQYDPATNSWGHGFPFFPDARRYSASGLLNGKWIIAGGRINPQVPLNSAWSLDLANPSATWVALPTMPVAVEGPVGAVVGNTFYAVGGFTTGPGASQVVQRYWVGASCASSTPTATASPTVTATASPTGTATATLTPGACNISFGDVQPSDYFYTPVQNLACRGVISGYADGTYRPYNNTTRGQMAKIVVGAFGLPIQTPAAGGQTFADVAPGSTFFAYIETATTHAIVGGYACGGTGEPCDGAGRPYYRPGSLVTRGQLTKMAVTAAMEQQGWTLLTPATPTFSDVQPSNGFYSYIETAVCHGVLGGYSDGTFRPGNSALRGQIAKIVYNAGLNLACNTR